MKIHVSIRFALFIFCFLSVSSCEKGHKEPDAKISSQLETLESVQAKKLLVNELGLLRLWILEQEKVDDTSDVYMFRNVLVKDLYRNGRSYRAVTNAVIADESIGLEIKRMLIKLSQCLTLDEYLELGDVVYTTNNIQLMGTYLSPGPEYGFILDQYHANIEVRKFLEKVIGRFPDLKENVELTTSGETLTSYIEYIRYGSKYPALSCPPGLP